MRVPEPPQRAGEPERRVGIPDRASVQSSAARKFGWSSDSDRTHAARSSPRSACSERLGQLGEMARVTRRRLLELVARSQLLERVLADRLEHQIARRRAGALRRDEALVDERRDAVGCLEPAAGPSTAAAASSRKPPTKTPSLRTPGGRPRRGGRSSSRGSPEAPGAARARRRSRRRGRASRVSSRSSSASGGSARTRGAASSIESGRPSSRSTTCGDDRSIEPVAGTNRLGALHEQRDAALERQGPERQLPLRAKPQRLAAGGEDRHGLPRARGARRSTGAASSTCSTLSIRSSVGGASGKPLDDLLEPIASRAAPPRRAQRRSRRERGRLSVIRARSTKYAPPAKASREPAATSSASRVFPTPPGPVSVIKPRLGERATAAPPLL